MTEDALSELRVQNAKDAYVALFNALGPNHYATLKASYELASVLNDEADGNEAEAYQYAKTAYEALRSRQGELDIPLIRVADEYFFCMAGCGRSDEYLEKYQSIMEECGGEEQVREQYFDVWHSCQVDMAHMQNEKGNTKASLRLLREALRGCEEEYGFAEKDTILTLMHLLVLIRIQNELTESSEEAAKEIDRFNSRWKRSGEEPEIRPIIVSIMKAAFSEKKLTQNAIDKVDRQLQELDEYSQFIVYPLIEYIYRILHESDELEGV